MKARLFVIPGSHPSIAGRLMLERKGIPYSRVDLVPAISRAILKAARFPGHTVPGLILDGRRIQGSREIARELEALWPDPPLFPSDPDRRREVEEAERFGDEELQPVPRRLTWWAMSHDNSSSESFLEGARLGLPTKLAAATTPPIAKLSRRLNKATDEAVRADLAALPGLLDRVDSYVERGVVGGDEPNAADYQLATSIGLLMCFDDLRPAVEGRPAAELARRIVPDYPGRARPVFPPQWLEPLRGAAAPA